MNKKNAVISGYFVKNLGDDLMLKSFINEYCSFYDKIYIVSRSKYRKYYEEMGVEVKTYDSLFNKFIKLICFILNKPDYFYRLTKRSNTDFIILGGSVFIESSNIFSRKKIINNMYAVSNADNSYIIGSNFGPYNSNEFYNSYRDIFKKCTDICFRDYYSYELFSDISSVRFAPDIVLSGIWRDNNINNTRESIIISPINLENRAKLNNNIDKYETILAEIANYHADNNENVILMSFCERENDLDSCYRIKNKCTNRNNINIMSYEDLTILNYLSNAKIIYGTRFHAIILAIYFNIPCMPFAYSTKTINALNSLLIVFHM